MLPCWRGLEPKRRRGEIEAIASVANRSEKPGFDTPETMEGAWRGKELFLGRALRVVLVVMERRNLGHRK